MTTALSKKQQSAKEHHESIVDDGMKSILHMGLSLKELKDGELWSGDYESWDDYCRKRFKFTGARGDQFIKAGIGLKNLEQIVEKHSVFLPSSEGQVRALMQSADVDSDRAKVWVEVVKRSEEAGKPPTAKLINTVADEIVGPKIKQEKPQKAAKAEKPVEPTPEPERQPGDDEAEPEHVPEPKIVDESPEGVERERLKSVHGEKLTKTHALINSAFDSLGPLVRSLDDANENHKLTRHKEMIGHYGRVFADLETAKAAIGKYLSIWNNSK